MNSYFAHNKKFLHYNVQELFKKQANVIIVLKDFIQLPYSFIVSSIY